MRFFRKSPGLILLPALFLPVGFAFWFVTATACTAVQRSVSAGGKASVVVGDAFDLYAAPLKYCMKIPALSHMADYFADKWCDILDAPDTTP